LAGPGTQGEDRYQWRASRLSCSADRAKRVGALVVTVGTGSRDSHDDEGEVEPVLAICGHARRLLHRHPDIIQLNARISRADAPCCKPAPAHWLPEIAREQQGMAAAFAELKLIPKPIEVKDAFLNLDLGLV
jgi:hypothetical protein